MSRYIDAYLRPLIVSMLVVGGLSMAMLLAFRGTVGVSHLAFFLWGLAFGPLVTMWQTAVIKRAGETKDVSTSVQSSVFNLSIMIATWLGGLMLTWFPDTGVRGIVYMSLVCFILAAVISFLSRRTLRSSTAPPSQPTGDHHGEEVHQRPDLPSA